jgi:hypothetical protein
MDGWVDKVTDIKGQFLSELVEGEFGPKSGHLGSDTVT